MATHIFAPYKVSKNWHHWLASSVTLQTPGLLYQGAVPYTMVVGGDRRCKVFVYVVSLFYLKITKLIVGIIQRFVSMYLPYFIQITVTLLLF